jgi:hypothetical protein
MINIQPPVCPNLQAVISYYDVDNSALKVARKGVVNDWPNCNSFTLETVDNNDSNDFDGKGTSIELIGIGGLAIAYSSQDTASGDGILMYTEKVGSGGTGCSNSTNPGTWTCVNAGSIRNAKVGQYPSLAGYEDRETGWVAGISHYDGTNKDLYFTTGSLGGVWSTTLVDETGDVGEYTSIAYAPGVWTNGGPWHISYYDASDLVLKYANGTIVGGTGGTCEALGGPGDWDCYKANTPVRDATDYGKYTSIVVPAGGRAPIGVFKTGRNTEMINQAFAAQTTIDGGGGASNQIVIGYFNASQNGGDAKITFGKGPEPEQPKAIPEFKNYWYIAITAVAALTLFFIVRWQFKKKEVKK